MRIRPPRNTPTIDPACDALIAHHAQPRDVPLVYICSPFSGESPDIVEENIEAARKCAQRLMYAFPCCPVLSHTWWEDTAPEDIPDEDQILKACIGGMLKCDMVVVNDDGPTDWAASQGCLTEVATALHVGIPVYWEPVAPLHGKMKYFEVDDEIRERLLRGLRLIGSKPVSK